MPRNKRRDPATTITQFPGVNQSGMPVSSALEAHAPTHEDGGSDPLSVLDLAGYSGNASDVLKGDASWGSVAGTGDVVGPASAVNNDVAVYDGVTGKLLKDSGVLVTNLVLTSDARLSDARTPTAHTHAESDVTGLVADLAATEKTANKNAASGYAGLDASSKLTGSQQKYGSAANTAAEGNDARLSDARTPTAHATSHRSGGSDALVFDQTTSATGTQNNFSLSGPNTVLQCSGAAPVFTGFTIAGAAPVAGDRAVLVYTGSGTLRVAKEDAGSTAANRITSPSARGQIVGVGGMITVVYESASRWGVQAVEPGNPITIPYAAGDFTATGSMVWTVDSGDVQAERYIQRGNQLMLMLLVQTTTTSGTAAAGLLFLLPNGFTVATQGTQEGVHGSLFDGTYNGPGMWVIITATSTTKIAFYRPDFLNLALVTNNVSVQGSATLLID